MSLVTDAYIEEPGASVMLGLRMQGTDDSQGILFAIDTTSVWGVWHSVSAVGNAPSSTGTSPVAISAGAWHTYRADVNGTLLNVWIDGTPVITNLDVSGYTNSGHGLIGTKAYGQYTQYDNFQLYTAFTTCGATPLAAGAAVNNVVCSAEVGPVAGSQFSFAAPPNSGLNATISLRSNPALCVAANAATNLLELAACNPADGQQQWVWTFDGIAPDGERGSSIELAGQKLCIDIDNQVPDVGTQLQVYNCNRGTNQAFFFDFDAGEIANEWSSTCIGVC